MTTYADVGMIRRWEQQGRPTPEEQARIDARAMDRWRAEAREIGALTELVLLGPPGGAVGAAAWSRDARARLDRFRLAGSLRAENGGAEVLQMLERQIERTEVAAKALLAERRREAMCSSCRTRLVGPCCDLCGDCRAAEASLGRACCGSVDERPS